MPGRIAQTFIDELIGRADIVELIASRVALKKAGHEYKACCPFHDEKTPSFWVSPNKQFYHCFGCGAHGTVIGFLMEYDRLPFPEAIEELAGRLGLEVQYEDASASSSARPDARESAAQADAARALYELMARVAEHFRAQLASSERARSYAQQRGLSQEIIERFGIGYASDSWNELLRRFGANERAQRDLAAAGLIVEHERDGPAQGARDAPYQPHYYDRFRDRLMFPIRDTRGRVIAFGGRVMGSGEPKYLNSPETVLFHKGKELYGLYESRLARTKLSRLLIVEGYMDTVRLHQHGLPYAVATLGTATTPEHVRSALRLVSEIVFCFDGDRAGRAAAWRALQNVLPEVRAGREVRFLFLPDGEDPDSLVGREGGASFEARLSSSVPLSEYLIAELSAQTDIAHADGKARFIALAGPLLEKLPTGVYRELLLERMAQVLQLSASRLQQWLMGREPPAVAASVSARWAPGAARLPGRPDSGRTSAAGGRGSLVTQAITLLLHFPAAASEVKAPQRTALQRLEQPAAAVLSELLVQQIAQPAASMAQTLERWRERPEYRRLCELATAAPLVQDASAAARELCEAIQRLIDGELRRRLETLIGKARDQGLSEAEKAELQSLTVDQRRGMAAPAAGTPPPG
jgi:DNA primase